MLAANKTVEKVEKIAATHTSKNNFISGENVSESLKIRAKLYYFVTWMQ